MRVVARPPANLLTIPAETLACELSRPWSGKPTTTASPGLIGLSPRTSAESATGSDKRKIGCRVRRDKGRHDWGPIVQHAHLATGVDDMVVGEDIPGPADNKSGTARAQPLAARRSAGHLPRCRRSFLGVRASWGPGFRGGGCRFGLGESDFLRKPVATPRCLVAQSLIRRQTGGDAVPDVGA